MITVVFNPPFKVGVKHDLIYNTLTINYLENRACLTSIPTENVAGVYLVGNIIQDMVIPVSHDGLTHCLELF